MSHVHGGTSREHRGRWRSSAMEQMGVYLRLDAHIECLRADRRPPRPPHLSVDQARLFQMAALVRIAAPRAAELDPAFRAHLTSTLQRLLQSPLRPWWAWLYLQPWATRWRRMILRSDGGHGG